MQQIGDWRDECIQWYNTDVSLNKTKQNKTNQKFNQEKVGITLKVVFYLKTFKNTAKMAVNIRFV